MRDLIWYEPWSWPVYDEPEDWPDGFPAFLAANEGKPVAIAYWDIAKAKVLGLWREDRAEVLLFNWYPACSAVPMLFRWAYVPFKVLQYRAWYSKRRVPCYLTLWTGKYDGKDEYGNTYWKGGFLNQWSWFWFRTLLWPCPTGRAWF